MGLPPFSRFWHMGTSLQTPEWSFHTSTKNSGTRRSRGTCGFAAQAAMTSCGSNAFSSSTTRLVRLKRHVRTNIDVSRYLYESPFVGRGESSLSIFEKFDRVLRERSRSLRKGKTPLIAQRDRALVEPKVHTKCGSYSTPLSRRHFPKEASTFHKDRHDKV